MYNAILKQQKKNNVHFTTLVPVQRFVILGNTDHLLGLLILVVYAGIL